ncbi:unnamed protein product [Brachionus calyciflorus]|uniref:Retrotransposon gag domain-containing protein n=1 Tax=Brachionus calyciflorus TaxID=104777 RepID=A0A814F0N6_9BILA|nr:unnamed protein product [Brachionus calyciflorus]
MSQLSIFRGFHSEHVDEWLYALNSNLEISKVSEKEKLLNAADFIRERAREVMERIKMSNPNISWKKFQKKFRDRFRAEDIDEKLYDELHEIKETGSMVDFIERILYLIGKIVGSNDEKFKIFWFLKRIKEKKHFQWASDGNLFSTNRIWRRPDN